MSCLPQVLGGYLDTTWDMGHGTSWILWRKAPPVVPPPLYTLMQKTHQLLGFKESRLRTNSPGPAPYTSHFSNSFTWLFHHCFLIKFSFSFVLMSLIFFQGVWTDT